MEKILVIFNRKDVVMSAGPQVITDSSVNCSRDSTFGHFVEVQTDTVVHTFELVFSHIL